jgi:hypothetical protein
MSDAPPPPDGSDDPTAPDGVAERAEAEVVEDGALVPVDGDQPREQVDSPAKVMRVGSMIKQLLDEVRNAPLDDSARARMKDIYESSVQELGSALSPDLRDELASFTLPFDQETPSDAELRVAQAQLVGWLEGLFHGIQATLFAQQAAAQRQLQQVRGGGGGPGGPGAPGLPGMPPGGQRGPSGLPEEPLPGTYL